MKVYWSDAEGKKAPEEAQFHCLPFFPKTVTPFSQPIHRVENLPEPQSICALKRTFIPSKEEWIQSVKKVLAQKIQKVVLARCEILELEKAPDPFAIAAALRKKTEGTAHVFCFSEGQKTFLGASPERLFRREGQMIFSEAVAGTRRRGSTPEEDVFLGEELLKSKKDLSEFLPVQEFLQKTLTPFCQQAPQFAPIALRKTNHVQHLSSQGQAILLKNISDKKLLSRLHPTPALLGVPRQKAKTLIRALEPFDRGLYGGVVGWSCGQTSDWIVAIRSCWIDGHEARLYAGTGLVAGSNPEEEWEELNHKTKLYTDIFL